MSHRPRTTGLKAFWPSEDIDNFFERKGQSDLPRPRCSPPASPVAPLDPGRRSARTAQPPGARHALGHSRDRPACDAANIPRDRIGGAVCRPVRCWASCSFSDIAPAEYQPGGRRPQHRRGLLRPRSVCSRQYAVIAYNRFTHGTTDRARLRRSPTASRHALARPRWRAENGGGLFRSERSSSCHVRST